MSVHAPMISVDGLSYVKPQFIGLLAWLGSSSLWPSNRQKILTHVSKTGVVDETLLHAGFDGNAEDLAAAAEVHREWQRFLTELDGAAAPVAKTTPVLFKRNGVHVDPAGFNDQERPDVDF